MKTVADLISKLQEIEPSLIVAMSSDEEGNRIEEWSGDIGFAVYAEGESWGDQFTSWLYSEDEDGTETEEQVTSETATAVIIWP